MKKALIFSVVLLCSFGAGAQVEGPPSLLIGLAGLTGERGNIDVQLLSEIITEKQGELKKEFLKREVYSRLENRSYVVWEFAYNSLEMLLNSTDKKAMEKEVLEYAANLALVYSFTETYLQVSDKLCNSDLEAVVRAWNHPPASGALDPYFTCPPTSLNLKKLWLPELKNTDGDNLSAVLIDLVFDILRQNKTLHDLGFFQSQLPLGEEYYNMHSRYKNAKPELKAPLEKLRTRIEGEVGVLIDYYYVIKVAINKNISLSGLSKTLKAPSPSFDEAQLFTDLAKVSETINKSTQQKDAGLSDKISEALTAFLDFKKRTDDSVLVSRADRFRTADLYYLEEVTGPLVIKLVTEYGLNPKYIAVVDGYRDIILRNLLQQIVAKLRLVYPDQKEKIESDQFSIVKGLKAVDYQAFVEILTHIYQLDKSSTYEEYLETLRSVGTIFDDTQTGRLIFNIADYLEKYTVLDKEKNAISVNVEEIILQLYNKYDARLQNNRVNFYFSIGLNQTLGINYKDGYELRDDSLNTLNSLSFAAEKIGFKVKLRDWRKLRSYEYGELKGKSKTAAPQTRKPLVNDVYWLVYGSGILYNIVNTTTGKDFSSPILGTGFGVSFYNSLDLNLFLNVPLVSSESLGESISRRQLFGFSFDIKIGDYITAVRKKRAENKSESK